MTIELENVNTNKLHDELINAGVIPSLVESFGNRTRITIEDNEEVVAREVISIHNPSPLPQVKTEEEKLKERMNAFEEAVNFLLGL